MQGLNARLKPAHQTVTNTKFKQVKINYSKPLKIKHYFLLRNDTFGQGHFPRKKKKQTIP